MDDDLAKALAEIDGWHEPTIREEEFLLAQAASVAALAIMQGAARDVGADRAAEHIAALAHLVETVDYPRPGGVV